VIDCGVTKKYLWNEWKKALDEKTTLDCRIHCEGCGLKALAKCNQEGGNA